MKRLKGQTAEIKPTRPKNLTPAQEKPKRNSPLKKILLKRTLRKKH
ncbi:MAG: hypothetical protein ACLTK0_03040 [Anaerovoracaceae bacterium]